MIYGHHKKMTKLEHTNLCSCMNTEYIKEWSQNSGALRMAHAFCLYTQFVVVNKKLLIITAFSRDIFGVISPAPYEGCPQSIFTICKNLL